MGIRLAPRNDGTAMGTRLARRNDVQKGNLFIKKYEAPRLRLCEARFQML